MKHYLYFILILTVSLKAQVGINTTNPNAQLDIRSSNQANPSNTDGLLIPKVDAFPVTNPGADQNGMMVFLTSTVGTLEKGFYYWDSPTNSWRPLNNNGSTYYVALGTTNAVSTGSFSPVPQMNITFTPKSDMVFFNFSGAGYLTDIALNPTGFPAQCRQGAIYFQILLNGTPVKSWQTNVEDISNTANYPLWDTSIIYPIVLAKGIPQTISLIWAFPSCENININLVNNTIIGRQAHRFMTIIDPNGGDGVVGTLSPVLSEFWSMSGNAGIDPNVNFLGTIDNVDLHFRRNDLIAGSIKANNTSLGVQSLDPNSVGNNNAAFGSGALQLTTSGSFNAAFGSNAIRTNTIGSYNSGFGYNSSVASNNLTNATAVGAFSEVASSNAMVLGSISGVNGATETVQVGIGTTSPGFRLHVVGATRIEGTSFATTETTPGNLHVVSTSPQGFGTGASISLGGNLTATGDSRVFGTIEGRKTNFISGSSNGYLAFKTLNGGTLEERVRITNIGRVGVGTTTPGGQFELSLDQGRKPGTTTWTIVSDARLKTVKGPYEKGLEEILKLNPIVYNYKNETNRKFEAEVLQKPFAGFLAHEVQKIFPEAVEQEEDGFLNFNIHPILIASINAFKEMKRLNNQLLEENQLLKSKLEDIIKRLETLEKK